MFEMSFVLLQRLILFEWVFECGLYLFTSLSQGFGIILYCNFGLLKLIPVVNRIATPHTYQLIRSNKSESLQSEHELNDDRKFSLSSVWGRYCNCVRYTVNKCIPKHRLSGWVNGTRMALKRILVKLHSVRLCMYTLIIYTIYALSHKTSASTIFF